MNIRTLFVLVAVVVVTMMASGSRLARAQEGCPPDQVCNPVPCDVLVPDLLVLDNGDETPSCTTQVAPFTPMMDTWTYVFDDNNAIKIGAVVTCPGFPLKVDMIQITQLEYATLRRHPDFADTVCNPTFGVGTDCVFYRVHGETVPEACYNTAVVDYKIFWNTPPISGNKHDWMLLRAPCDEFFGDPNPCFTDPPFSEDITTSVDKRPPVGTDPVVGGEADGMSDYIVAISNRHPHPGGGIPATIP
jgi:hypothetical protein